jgi:dTDP-4-dehydrorhamnose reductase
MTTLILGSAGQLGTAFRRVLPDAATCTREQADLANAASLRAAVPSVKPAVVLNCGAYNAVDRAESDVAGAFAVNAFGVRELALACRDAGAALVHFSTNYVFGQDDDRRIPYRETDAPGPISAYGVSKLAGEYFALTISPKNLVIRTCGLFGITDRAAAPWNFIEKLLDRARRGEKLRVVNDQELTPTAAADLAAATLKLLQTDATGLYHFTNAGACTWHEFACAALCHAGLHVDVEAVTSDAINAPARRPRYSVLDCSAYERRCGAARATWQEALAGYFQRQ